MSFSQNGDILVATILIKGHFTSLSGCVSLYLQRNLINAFEET